MSPLLATLALLALCWPPSTAVSWTTESLDHHKPPSTAVSWTTESLDHHKLVSYISKKQQSAVAESIRSLSSVGAGRATPDQLVHMFNLLPNTLTMMGLQASEAMDMITFLRLPLINGLLCELADAELPAKLNAIMYNGSEPTAEDKQELASIMKDEYNVDCAAKPPKAGFKNFTAAALKKAHRCFCTEKKGAICFFSITKFTIQAESEKKKIPLTKSFCLNETLPALFAAGSGALGATWKDLEKTGLAALNDAVSGNVAAFSAKADILCDAVNPDVEKAFKAVYSSNGVYWLAESAIFLKAFGPQNSSETEQSLPEVCSQDALRDNAYGKCICQQDSGFIYCIYKVFAESFISEGSLTCDKADKTKHKFEKEPSALPQLPGVKAKSEPGSTAAPTGSGAATSSLTAASLAAAALLLLRE